MNVAAPGRRNSRGRTLLLTSAALTAFAANSVLCRMALGREAIDAASFTVTRVGSGALALWIIARASGRLSPRSTGEWRSAAALAAYAAAFSFAYLELSTGTGALILFGAVQLTMIATGLVAGERPGARVWAGLLTALAGLVYLVLPGVSAPSLSGASLMATAGVAWGIYSLRGRRAGDALGATAANFARAAPLVALLLLVPGRPLALSPRGLVLAVVSGALASGIGYVIWYAALPGLTATRAATVQLAVPVIAAAGGVALLGERPTLRLAVASAVVLGGIGLAIAARASRA